MKKLVPDNPISMFWRERYDRVVEKIKLKRECGFIRDAKDPSKPDVRCIDGIADYGQRIVSKAGSVRMVNERWQHELLIPFAGCSVGVHVNDYWMSSVDIYYPDYPHGELIMRLHARKE